MLHTLASCAFLTIVPSLQTSQVQVNTIIGFLMGPWDWHKRVLKGSSYQKVQRKLWVLLHTWQKEHETSEEWLSAVLDGLQTQWLRTDLMVKHCWAVKPLQYSKGFFISLEVFLWIEMAEQSFIINIQSIYDLLNPPASRWGMCQIFHCLLPECCSKYEECLFN